MNKKQDTQQELFRQFLKEFNQCHLCFYCLNSWQTTYRLFKLPGERFFQHLHLCNKCIQDLEIEVK